MSDLNEDKDEGEVKRGRKGNTISRAIELKKTSETENTAWNLSFSLIKCNWREGNFCKVRFGVMQNLVSFFSRKYAESR